MDWILDQLSASSEEVLSRLGTHWQQHFNTGTFSWQSHAFWTQGFAYCDMHKAAPDLYQQLSHSDFIAFKGDLNYRKMVGDRYWPLYTPFRDSLCGFEPAPFIALRTLKAETCPGLPAEAIQRMGKEFGAEDRGWMVSSEYAVAQLFLPSSESH